MSTLKVKGKGKFNARTRRHLRVRKRISGTTVRPRLVVNRSARHMFVQVVDDTQSRTLAYASTMEADVRALEGDKTAKAKRVGELVAERSGPGADRLEPAEVVRRIADEVDASACARRWVIFDNTAAGCAVPNAAALQARVKSSSSHHGALWQDAASRRRPDEP